LSGACDSPTSSTSDARVTVLLTDAPHEYLESAVVTIGRIELRQAGGPPVEITTDGGMWDLLQLQNGVTAALGEATIEPGRYLEMRMIVSEAVVTLKDGFTFTDGSATKNLAVPSGAASGIKVKLRSSRSGAPAGIEIRPGETSLVIDFDVSQNFRIQGNPNSPAGIRGFLFKPVLRVEVEDLAGSIAGSVSAPAEVEVEGLTVTATRVDAEPDDAVITTLVREDGTFKLHFVAAGSYNVTVAAPAGYTAAAVQKVVGESEDVTGVELVIAAQ
jgi:hypothetical protein